MKKILFISLLLFSFSLKVLGGYLVLPGDFILGKIENISDNSNKNYSKSVKLENYTHYKLPEFGNFLSYDLPINYNISITNYSENLNIKKGDIVILSPTYSKKYSSSVSINKVSCDNGKIIFSPNSIIGLTDYDVKKIQNKISSKIPCNELDNFFSIDRRFEDLYGTNFKPYVYIFLGFFIFIVGITVLIIFKKLKIIKK